MTKSRQQASTRTPIVDRQLHAHDLARVRGGDNGVIHMDAVGGAGASTTLPIVQDQTS
jgi:hypothetical protein